MWEKTVPATLPLLGPHPPHTSECWEKMVRNSFVLEAAMWTNGYPTESLFWVWTKDKEVWSLSSNNELAKSQKTRNNSYCPWSAGSITPKLLGVGGHQALTGSLFQDWSGCGSGRTIRCEAWSFPNPFFCPHQWHTLCNCPQTGSLEHSQINRTDKSLEMTSFVITNTGPERKDKWHNK